MCPQIGYEPILRKKIRVFAGVKDGRVDNYRNEFCLACNVSKVSSRVGAGRL